MQVLQCLNASSWKRDTYESHMPKSGRSWGDKAVCLCEYLVWVLRSRVTGNPSSARRHSGPVACRIQQPALSINYQNTFFYTVSNQDSIELFIGACECEKQIHSQESYGAQWVSLCVVRARKNIAMCHEKANAVENEWLRSCLGYE